MLPCYLVSSSRGRLLVIPMTIFLQASRSLVKPHSSVSVQFIMALMSSSHRARGLPLFLAPPPIPNIIEFSKLFSLRMMCPIYDSCCFFISDSSGLVALISISSIIMSPRTKIFITTSVFEDKFKLKFRWYFSSLFHVTSVTPIFSIPI